MKKGLYILVACLVVFSTLLSACNSTGKTETPSASTEAPVEATATESSENVPGQNEQVVLHMIAATGGSSNTFLVAAQDYEAKTGVKVDIQVISYADVHDKQILQLRNQSDGLDVIVVDGSIWLAELQSFLEPLDGYVSKDGLDTSIFVPTMLDSMMITNSGSKVLYGLPVRIGPWVLIYRTDLFEQANLEPPKTMEDFQTAAQALTKDGVYGFAASFKQGNYLVAQWLPFLYSYGGSLLNEDNTAAAFNTDAGRNSLQFLVDLYNKYNVIPPSAIDSEQDGIINAMEQGMTAMAITYSPYFLTINNPENSSFAGNFAVAPYMPYAEGSGLTAGQTEISGWGLAVSKYSKNKDLAWDFIKFVASSDEQKKLAVENSNSPTISAVYSDPDYLSVYSDAQEVLAIANNSRKRPGIVQWTNVEDILATELSAAITGVKTVDQALSDAESQINSLLSQ